MGRWKNENTGVNIMKRIICILLMGCMLLISGGVGVAAEAEYDFSGLDLEQLYEIREQLNAQISALEHQDGLSIYESGSYLVGRDIPAGEYALIAAENAILSTITVRTNDSADSDLIAYGLINHQAMVHLDEGTWVTLSEVTAYPLSDSPAKGLEDGVAGEGAYVVGLHIPAGTYTVSATEKAPLSSYSVYDGMLGTDAQLIKFEVLHDDVSVELAEGEYIELSGCQITQVNDEEVSP